MLTLPATGSESNKGAVVSRKTTGDKRAHSCLLMSSRCLRSSIRFYLYPCRRVKVANGVVDAFVHTVEQYVTYPVDGKIQDRFAEAFC
ncbi:hypothetical protein DMH17_06115 [Raoultella planticola]|nr:hypothetical protein [Raoultella planticola]